MEDREKSPGACTKHHVLWTWGYGSTITHLGVNSVCGVLAIAVLAPVLPVARTTKCHPPALKNHSGSDFFRLSEGSLEGLKRSLPVFAGKRKWPF